MLKNDFPKGCIEVYVAPDESGIRAGLGLTGPSSLLKEVPIVGWASLSTAQHLNIPDHSHDAYEIIYTARGSSDWWVGDSVYELQRGDVYLTRPGEHHGLVNAILTPSEHYWIQVQFTAERLLPGMCKEDSLSLSHDMDAMQFRCFAASQDIANCFSKILKEHRSPGPYSTMLAQAALHALLIHLIRDHDHHMRRMGMSHAVRSPIIRKAMDQIDRRLDQPLSALEIPVGHGMSDSLFHQRFLAEVGWTPIEYRTRCRILRAKSMLYETNQTVTEIALALGFRSSQYFATVFKRETGVTPGQYREHILRILT